MLFVNSNKPIRTNFPFTTQGNYYSNFCHHKLILPDIELHIKGTTQHILLDAWVLSFNLRVLRNSILIYTDRQTDRLNCTKLETQETQNLE